MMRRWIVVNGGLLVACGVAAFVALNLGPEPVTLFSAGASDPTDALILWSVRLPRIGLALCVGAALASAGTAYQVLLRNPLADPYILGVSGGAALGAALAAAFRLPFAGIVGTAFAASLVCMWAIARLAARPGGSYSYLLLLTGVVFNAFAFAVILFLHAILPIDRSYEVLAFLMGNLALGTPGTLGAVACAVAAGGAILLARAAPMNALLLGDEVAASLGIDPRRLEREIFIAGSLMVGATVAVSGLIGFVGLFIPHLVRLLGGNDHRLLLPASALAGAGFLLAADTAARVGFTGGTWQMELPVGVITALIGAPVFLLLLRRGVRSC